MANIKCQGSKILKICYLQNKIDTLNCYSVKQPVMVDGDRDVNK